MPADDLVTTEGVDEGSSTPEPMELGDVTDATEPTGPEPLSEPSPPVPPETTPTQGPGQQLAEGEG